MEWTITNVECDCESLEGGEKWEIILKNDCDIMQEGVTYTRHPHIKMIQNQSFLWLKIAQSERLSLNRHGTKPFKVAVQT